MESAFDENASAMDKNRKKSELLEKQIKNQEKQVEELEKGLQASKEKYGENATQTQKWQQAVSNAKTDLAKFRKELEKVPKPLSQIGKNMQNVGKKMQSIGGTLTKAVTAPLVGMGAAAVASWYEVDEAMDVIVTKTGASGEALEAMQTSAKNIATTIPTSFATASEAVGEVNTRFGVTGEELESLSTQFVQFAALNNTDVSSSVDKVQKVMQAFGVDTKDAGKVLDVLNKTGQNTGVSMDTLEASMIKNAAALQGMGMDAYEAAGFLGSVETSGANTETVMSGLSKALVNAGEDGKTLPEALGEFQTVMNSTASEQDKLNAAIDLFGQKAGPTIYEACRQGSLSFESLSTDASDYLGSVSETFQETLDPADKFTTTMNSLKEAGSEIGGTLLEIAAPAVEGVGEAAKKAGEWFASLDEDQQKAASAIAAAFAVTGPALTALGHFTELVGTAIEKVGELKGAADIVGGVASPAGLAIGGLIALTAVMVASRDEGIKSNDALQAMLSDTATATDELNTATGSLQETITAANENIDSINAKASTAEELVEELYALEEQSSRTAAEQGRMFMIVEELNTMYPNLSLSIDKTTGALNKGKSEVKGYIQEAKKLALIDAYTKASKETLGKLADAHISLKKAQKAQADGQAYVTQAQQEYNDAIAKAPIAMAGQNSILDEATGKWHLVDATVTNAANAVYLAQDNMKTLNQAVSDGEAAIASAEEEYQLYVDSAEELSSTLTKTNEAQEKQTEVVEESVNKYAAVGAAIRNFGSQASGVWEAQKQSIADQVKAWDDLYNATKESIDGQIGLFDEWKQDTEITADDILKNLESQKIGFENYNKNLSRLTKMATESGDKNLQNFVKSVAEMGISGAGYLQALVDATYTDMDKFSEIVSDTSAIEGFKNDTTGLTTYVVNDFTTKGQAAAQGLLLGLQNVGGSGIFSTIARAFGTAANSAIKASNNVKTQSNKNMAATKAAITNTTKAYDIFPAKAQKATADAGVAANKEVGKMDLRTALTVDASKEMIQSTKGKVEGGLKGIKAAMSSVTGAAAAGKTARSTIEGKLQGIPGTVKLSPATGAITSLKQEVQNSLGYLSVKLRAANKVKAENYATGGLVDRETLTWVAEEDKPEMIIPLDPSKRARAMSLYAQAGEMLGATPGAAPAGTIHQTTTMTLPSGDSISNSTQLDGSLTGLDPQSIYAAVSAGAEEGMKNANVRLYVGDREVGRLLRNMGVQFA